MNHDERARELEALRKQVREMEDQLAEYGPKEGWEKQKFYTTYHLLAGMMLGFFGAAASLLFNVVGSVIVGQYPLQLVRVYLTFPLGERALQIESGAVIALGCCFYLFTGAAIGALVHLILSRFFEKSGSVKKFMVSTVLGLAIWLINFYGFLSWVQPMLFHGDWIVRLVPFWVAALTHLVFTWTVMSLGELGRFERHEADQ